MCKLQLKNLCELDCLFFNEDTIDTIQSTVRILSTHLDY